MGSIYKKKWKDKDGNVHESKAWWIKYYRNGKAYRESTGKEKESQAKRELKLREGDIAKGVPVTPNVGRVKFQELADDVVTDYRVNGRKTLKDLNIRLKLHILSVFGHHRAANITTAHIRTFIARRQEEEASNGEINRELTVVKRAFNLALESGKLISKPHVPMLKENNVRKGFFERKQFESVRRHLPRIIRPLVTFFYITGWRLSEVLSLQWRQVDFEAGRVYLDPGTTKNDDARVFPFTDELRETLKTQQQCTKSLKEKGQICPWVFHRNGKQIKSIRRIWATACKKAGVPGSFVHDFRRTAVRNLVRAGVPERVAMQMTGHKTRSVFERYNIVNEADLETAAQRLNDFTDAMRPLKGQALSQSVNQ